MTKFHYAKVLLVATMLTFSSLGLAAEGGQETAEQVAMLDINSADATAIAEALDGVGLVKAKEIVAYREMFGEFESVDELLEVEGIGPATVEKNRHRIIIVKK